MQKGQNRKAQTGQMMPRALKQEKGSMQGNKDHFLDSKTLVAIIFLIISWLGWDYYMRKKYPPVSEKATEIPLESNSKTATQKETRSSDFKFLSRAYKEEILEFKGKNMEILFSSKGFGIKQLKLVNYQNRQKKTVVFISQDIPLFSSFFLKNTKQIIPFKIKRQGELFVGLFSSPEGVIKKTVFVDENRFVLTGQMEIEPKAEHFKGLSLVFFSSLARRGKQRAFKFISYLRSRNFKGLCFLWRGSA